MSLIHILIVVLIVVLVLSLPHWGYSPNYYPAGGLGLVLIILVVLLLLGRV